MGLGLALVMVIGLGVTGWLYFSGRFGVGPLSAADKEAVSTIAEGVEAPEWADDDQRECAADELVHESRSGELERRGVIDRDGDGWEYTGKWRVADGTSYFEKLLDCDDDWADTIGKTWNLADTDCLDEIGTETVGAYFAKDLLEFANGEGDSSADEGHKKAIEELDACYVKAPADPQATAKSAYRAVSFTFAEVSADASGAGEVVLNTGGPGNWTRSSSTIEIETPEGGKRGCVSAQTLATYPWGSTAEAQKRFCGTSQPKRVFWKKVKGCDLSPGCGRWEFRYEGFQDLASITAYYTSNGGFCMSTENDCADSLSAAFGGSGKVTTWQIPASYDGNFVGRIGKLKARIPN